MKIFGHRGSAGTHPENTMAAYKETLRVGANGIELDVQQTKDGKLVVIHDETVNRTTNGEGYVFEYTLEELQQLDAGSWFDPKFKGEKIPTLGEVFTWMQENDLLLNIELKYVTLEDTGFEEQVLAEIEKYQMTDRVILSSFNHEALKKITDLNKDIECGVLYVERMFEPWHYAKAIGARALHPYDFVTDKGLIDQAKAHNLSVRPYTVNDEKSIEMFLAADCPAIITDFPERAVKIRKNQ